MSPMVAASPASSSTEVAPTECVRSAKRRLTIVRLLRRKSATRSGRGAARMVKVTRFWKLEPLTVPRGAPGVLGGAISVGAQRRSNSFAEFNQRNPTWSFYGCLTKWNNGFRGLDFYLREPLAKVLQTPLRPPSHFFLV